jgi:hypothetical protein
MDEPRSLDSLFKEKLFRIPDYQRGYAWQREQLRAFWEDLVNLAADRFHYTGVLTLNQVPVVHQTEKEFWLVEDHSYKLYHIVDGQQRLTTFVIFLQAFVEFVKSLPENRDKTDAAVYVTDSLSVAAIQEKYLYKVKPTGDRFRTYKFGYIADNPSYEYLRHRVLGEEGGGSVQETFYTLNLGNAKHYFAEQLAELHRVARMSGLHEVYKKLTKQFLFNEYIFKDEFDVFVAFETMNNRGKRLSDLELLKNRLIYLTTLYDDADLDPADRKSLRDTINDAWKEVYHQLGRNQTRPLNDDDFLQAHWTMYFKYSRQTGRSYARFLLDEHFTPRRVRKVVEREVTLTEAEEQRAEEVIEDTDGEAEPPSNITAIVAALNSLPESQRDDILRQLGKGPSRLEPGELRDYVLSLKQSAVHWFNSFYPHLADGMTDDERAWLDRLNRVGIAYFRPLVMALLKNEPSPTNRVRTFQRIERFIFLAFRMGGARATYGNSEFYKAAREFDQREIDVAMIEKKLEERLAFKADGTLKTDDFANVLRKKFDAGTGYYGWSGLRYFLYEYELRLLAASRQRKVDWSDLLKSQKDKISIEHIFPQTESPDWSAAFSSVEPDQRYYYGASLGNLLLLSAAINSSLQNDSFADKKAAKYNAASEKVRNGYADGSHSEIEVSQEANWGPEQVRQRGMRLLSFMEARWDFRFSNDSEKAALLFLQ